MKHFSKISLFYPLLLAIMLSNTVSAQNKIENIPTVNLCDLVKNSALYHNQTVRIKATYRYGFEWSELFCSDCWDRDNNRIDVFFDESWRENTKRNLIKILTNAGDEKTINVVFVGRFVNPDISGDRKSSYQYQFYVSRAEKAKVVSKYSPVPPNLEPNIKRKTFCKTS